MEPTIYKPSIYNGAGVYNTGAEGGGGYSPFPENIEFYKYLIYPDNGIIDYLNINDFNCNNEDEFILNAGVLEIREEFKPGFSPSGFIFSTGQHVSIGLYPRNDGRIRAFGCNGGATDYDTNYKNENYAKKEYELKIITSTLYFDGITRNIQYSTANYIDLNFFVRQGYENYTSYGFLTKFKVQKNGMIKRLFLPAFNKDTGKVGVYEIVNNVFYSVQNNNGGFLVLNEL